MRTIKKTIRYYIIESDSSIHGAGHDYGADIAVAFGRATTVSMRLKSTATGEKNCFTNPIQSGSWWKGIQFVVYDEGYRPNKIAHDFNVDEVRPEAIQMRNDEDVAEATHLFVSGRHAILETSKKVSSQFAADYLTWLLTNNFMPTYPALALTPIANRDVAEEIRKHGVKKIELGLSTPWVSLPDEPSLYDTMAEEAGRLGAATAKLELKPVRKGWLDPDAAITLYQEDNESHSSSHLVFVLGNGSRAERSAFRLQKIVDAPCDASGNAQSLAMFGLMEDTFLGWETDGYIQRQSIDHLPP